MRAGTGTGATTADGSGAGVSYGERMSVPWWWWALALSATSLLAYEVHLGTPGVPVWLPLLVTVPLTSWALHRLGALRVDVVDDELRVGHAHLPLAMVSRVRAVPAGARRSALGPRLDPAAFVQYRAWVSSMVLIVLDDPDDPTPYWLVSTRHPDRLVEVVRRAGVGG